MSIYSREGDSGQTTLYSGQKISKKSVRIQLLGNIDELNAYIGWLISLIKASTFINKSEHRHEIKVILTLLEKLQIKLFEVGSDLAYDQSKEDKDINYSKFLRQIEKTIDHLEDQLPPLRNFILPGGTQTAATSHICRTIARRAERTYWRLHNKQSISVNNAEIGKLLNRVSDFFFILARYLNKIQGQKDILWGKA